MRILLINDYNFRIGGAEEIFLNSKLLLEEHGHKVKVFGSSDKGILPPLLLGWFSLKYYIELIKIIKNFKPDIVHVHACIRKISPSILVPIKKYNIPLIMTFHDFDILGPKYSLIDKKNFKLIRKIKLHYQIWMIKKYTDYYICPSKKLTKEIKKKFNSNEVSYIPNFYKINKDKYKSHINKNIRIFIYIGRLEKYKGIEVAVKAIYNLIKEDTFKNIKLYVIGNGAFANKLIELVKILHLQNNVKFLGKVPSNKLPYYYKISQALLIPSIYMENSPLVAYEAMSYKKPLIASNIGGLPDLIEHGKNGFLFKLGDEKSLSYFMKKIAINEKLSNKLGNYGYEKVNKEFSKKEYYQSLMSIYSKFISS